MDFWEARLNTAGCHVRAGQRFGEPLLQTSDRHGLPIELIGTVARPTTRFWNAATIDHQNAIFGFHSATATLHSLSDERTLLTQLGMHPLDREEERYRFEMGDDDTAGRLFDVLIDPQAPMGRSVLAPCIILPSAPRIDGSHSRGSQPCENGAWR